MNPDELEAADDWLEYEDSETYQHFLYVKQQEQQNFVCIVGISLRYVLNKMCEVIVNIFFSQRLL